jgi:hypothetical protein
LKAAYFFDYPGANMIGLLAVGSQGVPPIGTGTLNYGKPGAGAGGWLGASAFLLAESNRHHSRRARAPECWCPVSSSRMRDRVAGGELSLLRR